MFFSTYNSFENIVNYKNNSDPLMDILGHNNNVKKIFFNLKQNYLLDNSDDESSQNFIFPNPPPIKNWTDQEFLVDATHYNTPNNDKKSDQHMVTSFATHRAIAETLELTNMADFNFNNPINNNIVNLIQTEKPKDDHMTEEPKSEEIPEVKEEPKDSDDDDEDDEDYEDSGNEPNQTMLEEHVVVRFFCCSKDAQDKVCFSEVLSETTLKAFPRIKSKGKRKIIKASKDIKKVPKSTVKPTCEFCQKVFEKNNQLGGHVSRAHSGMSQKYGGKTLTRQSRTQVRSQLDVIRAHIIRKLKEI